MVILRIDDETAIMDARLCLLEHDPTKLQQRTQTDSINFDAVGVHLLKDDIYGHPYVALLFMHLLLCMFERRAVLARCMNNFFNIGNTYRSAWRGGDAKFYWKTNGRPTV